MEPKKNWATGLLIGPIGEQLKENLCKCLFKERCRHCWSKKGLHIFCLDWGDSHKDWVSQRLIKGWLRRREVWSHCQGDWEVQYQKADLILTASKTDIMVLSAILLLRWVLFENDTTFANFHENIESFQCNCWSAYWILFFVQSFSNMIDENLLIKYSTKITSQPSQMRNSATCLQEFYFINEAAKH